MRDDEHPFLAYSPMISIDNSSEPFRALLGAILSIVKKVPVEPTEFNPNIELDTIVEGNIDDGSAYSGSSREVIAYDPPITRSCRHTSQREAESGLMVCPCLPPLVICLAHLLLDHRVFPKFA